MNRVQAGGEVRDLAEVFSMPRIIPTAGKKGMRGLRSYDIGTGWDFLKQEHRRKRLSEIREFKPRLIMVCPPAVRSQPGKGSTVNTVGKRSVNH